jgi:putative two-component system response regulator
LTDAEAIATDGRALNSSITIPENSSFRILIVDDDQSICDLISRWLTSEGYFCATAATGEAATGFLEKTEFHLVLADIIMPGMSGVDLLTYIKSRSPDTAVILVTGVDDRKTASMTFEVGAWGYILKPFDFHDVILNVANALERRRLTLERRKQAELLRAQVEEKSRAVKERDRQMISVLLSALATHQDETPAHVERIGLSAAELAKYLRWGTDAVEHICLAAQLHDLGKLAIPDHVVKKTDQLTPSEFGIVKTHTSAGARILDKSDLPVIRMARDIALCHHECWDGSGYPAGLSGERIPESARIVAIVDVYDSLVHSRPYRRAFSEERAISIMQAYRGKAFDPRVFDYFMVLLPIMRRIQIEIND